MKAILALVACFIAIALAQNSCNDFMTSYECQLASTDTECCLWCKTKGQKQGRCVPGYIADQNAPSGTTTKPRRKAGYEWACDPNICNAGTEGRCAQTANCPGVTPYLGGTWYYPPECTTVGGQFNLILGAGNSFTVNQTAKQALRLGSFSGAVDTSGQLVLTDPETNSQCYGYASARQMSFSCPQKEGWGDCVQHFYRSSAATATLSVVAIVACIALAFF
jgi:hypothetical protein